MAISTASRNSTGCTTSIASGFEFIVVCLVTSLLGSVDFLAPFLGRFPELSVRTSNDLKQTILDKEIK